MNRPLWKPRTIARYLARSAKFWLLVSLPIAAYLGWVPPWPTLLLGVLVAVDLGGHLLQGPMPEDTDASAQLGAGKVEERRAGYTDFDYVRPSSPPTESDRRLTAAAKPILDRLKAEAEARAKVESEARAKAEAAPDHKVSIREYEDIPRYSRVRTAEEERSRIEAEQRTREIIAYRRAPLDADDDGITRSRKSRSEEAHEAKEAPTYVAVMFATDRRRAATALATRPDFAPGRGDGELTLGRARVAIPKNHRRAHIESPSFWKFQFKRDPYKHVTYVDGAVLSKAKWGKSLRSHSEATALVFVHGFNVSFEDALLRTAQIGFDLTFQGALVAFSWCSEEALTGYVADLEHSTLAGPRLLETLSAIRASGIETVHLVAHSMGNRCVLEALSAAPEASGSLGEVVFAAPDVDRDIFLSSLGKLAKKAKRYTLYASRHDRALVASRELRRGYARAGDTSDGVLCVSGVDTIDASAVGEEIFGLGHSYFGDKRTVLSDLHYVIRSPTPIGDRGLQRLVDASGLPYWVLVP